MTMRAILLVLGLLVTGVVYGQNSSGGSTADPPSIPPPTDAYLYSVSLKQGNQHLSAGEYAEAIACFARLKHQDKQDSTGITMGAMSYFYDGRYQQALDELDQLREEDIGWMQVELATRSLAGLDETKAAMDLLARYMDEWPDRPKGHWELLAGMVAEEQEKGSGCGYFTSAVALGEERGHDWLEARCKE